MDEEKARTVYCGNLSEKVTEDLLYELFLQAGPVVRVTLPKDKDGRKRNYAFITFKHEVSVPYSVALMKGVSLFGKQLRLEFRTGAEVEDNKFLENLLIFQNSQSTLGSEQGQLLNDYGSRDGSRGSERRYRDYDQGDNRFQNYRRDTRECGNYSQIQNFSPMDQRLLMMQQWQHLYPQNFHLNSSFPGNVNLNLYQNVYLNHRRF